MRNDFGFIPQYTAEEALREFGGENKMTKYMPESMTKRQEEDRLRDVIERRKRTREREALPPETKRKSTRKPKAAPEPVQEPLEPLLMEEGTNND
jgi:hypothetical protein